MIFWKPTLVGVEVGSCEQGRKEISFNAEIQGE